MQSLFNISTKYQNTTFVTGAKSKQKYMTQLRIQYNKEYTVLGICPILTRALTNAHQSSEDPPFKDTHFWSVRSRTLVVGS